MENTTLLVLASPREPTLAMLEELPDSVAIAAGESLEAFERVAAEAAALLHWSASGELLEQVFRLAPRLRWIHSRSAGLDELLFPALAESPVILTNGRGVFGEALAEFALAAALFFAKDLRRLVSSQAAGRWDPFDIRMLAGSTMGILGYGDIGKAVARRGRALDMNVIALRRRPGEPVEGAASEILGPEQKLELIRRSDYLVVAAPLTPETRGWIGERELEAMKPSAVVINVGRGAVIEERALIRALEQRRIAGAALDVFEQEPLPASHPFYSLDNVLLSPHSADHTPDWLERAMRRFLENFARFERGEPLVNVVDKRAGY